MSKRIELLKYLSTPKGVEDISVQLNLSDFATLELIKSIEEIERNLINKNRLGKYFLTRKLDFYNLNRLCDQHNLTDYTINILDEVPSTNVYAIDNILGLNTKTVITTEFQSHGKGRQNKQWINRVSTDIAMSCIYWFDLSFHYELLPLVSVIAVNRLLKDFSQRSYIKWPNDILLANEDKVAGILVEGGVKQSMRFAVIGIGLDNTINANRSEILVRLVKHLDNVLNEYNAFGFNLLKQEWLDNCIHYQKYIKILKDNNVIESGINIGIDNDGALLVKNMAGAVKKFSSTGISLRW